MNATCLPFSSAVSNVRIKWNNNNNNNNNNNKEPIQHKQQSDFDSPISHEAAASDTRIILKYYLYRYNNNGELFRKWRVFGVVVIAASNILEDVYFRYPYKRFRGPGIPIISTDFRIYYFRDEIISGPVVFYVARGCETPRGPGLGSESKRKKKIQKYKPEKRRNKRSIIKYAHIVGKGVAGEGTTRRRLLGSSNSGERKEKNSRRRRQRRLVRILFNDKSVEIYALRDYPAAAASKNTTCIFFFCPTEHTQITQKNTGTRAPIYIFIHYTHTRDEF